MSVLIAGVGNMGESYAAVLADMGAPCLAVGRSRERARDFQEKTGLDTVSDGIEKYLAENQAPETAIVAVTADQLYSVSRALLLAGVKNLLVEKPAGMNRTEVRELLNLSAKAKTKTYVAYNRRFFESVREARRLAQEDGGITSFQFEFTEWGHVIAQYDFSREILANWFYLNSTHVLDLAFFLGGEPEELKAFRSGSLDWHPSGAIFAGAGKTEKNALFSYHANWAGPGRWGLEFLTARRRFYFRPMEQLHIQKLGTVQVEKWELNDELDQRFKPGLHLLVNAFLNGPTDDLCSLEEHVRRSEFYFAINSDQK